MKVDRRWAVAFGLVLVLAVSTRAAIDPAFDFTGHWAGYAQEDTNPQQALSADLTTQPGTRAFTGTVNVASDPPTTCNLTGKQKRHGMKVKMRLSCDNGAKLKLHATLDAGAQMLTGGYRRPGRHNVHVGTFTLTKTS